MHLKWGFLWLVCFSLRKPSEIEKWNGLWNNGNETRKQCRGTSGLLKVSAVTPGCQEQALGSAGCVWSGNGDLKAWVGEQEEVRWEGTASCSTARCLNGLGQGPAGDVLRWCSSAVVLCTRCWGTPWLQVCLWANQGFLPFFLFL